jgi:hypothetical protein
MKSKRVVVNDSMQKGYCYDLVEWVGENFDPDFKPELTPKNCLPWEYFAENT